MPNTHIPRPEYPRPDFQRTEWLNLNGEWKFEFDDDNVGESSRWYENGQFTQTISVPFCYQSSLSGIDNKGMHEYLWYEKEFELPDSFKSKRVLLNFGAVDYIGKVWVNNQFAYMHKGGYTPFQVDITNFLIQGKNKIVVKAEDAYDCVQPRGKQYWKEKPDRCWYTPISGIWQSVWLETVGEVYLYRIRLTPDIDKRNVTLEPFLNKEPGNAQIIIDVSFNGKCVSKIIRDINDRISKLTIDIKEEDYIDEIHYWKPESPNLYDVEISIVKDGRVTDRIKSYFGMRKISKEGDVIMLNNTPYYQKLILDQGYWPESLLTPPSDEAIKFDIEMTKKFGFNGARKHQKIEDPRYYYWADKLGLLVWGEMPSAYSFNSEEIGNLTSEFVEFINRDFNHPCIITWVPLNESWGVRNIYINKDQQDFARSLYYLAKALDGTRLVSANDGWEQVDGDICGIHDYEAWGEEFTLKYADIDKLLNGSANNWRMLYANGISYQDQPILITEYGGIAFEEKCSESWGYFGAVKDEEAFIDRYSSITNAIKKNCNIKGYCYTQLTDVFQEVNGLMTMDRRPKVMVEKVEKINRT